MSAPEMPETYDAAIIALQANLPEIKKSRQASITTEGGRKYSYSYANLAGVTKKILPLLAPLGLTWQAMPKLNGGDKFVLAYRLRHVSGGEDVGEYPLPTSGTPQAIGSAITYARRYALCSVTGVALEDDDDDAAKASQQQETEQQKLRNRSAQRRNGQTTSEAPSEVGPRRISAVQQKKLGELFTVLSTTDKARRLTIAGKVVGRVITGSAELTADEAKKLIETLIPMAKAGDDGPLMLADLMREDGEPDAAA